MLQGVSLWLCVVKQCVYMRSSTHTDTHIVAYFSHSQTKQDEEVNWDWGSAVICILIKLLLFVPSPQLVGAGGLWVPLVLLCSCMPPLSKPQATVCTWRASTPSVLYFSGQIIKWALWPVSCCITCAIPLFLHHRLISTIKWWRQRKAHVIW